MELNNVFDPIDKRGSRFRPTNPDVRLSRYFDIDQRRLWLDRQRHWDPYPRDPVLIPWADAQTKIAAFICPSDTPYDKPDPIVYMPLYYDGSRCGRGHYAVGSPAGDALGRTNYLGVAGYWRQTGHTRDVDMYRGVFYNRSKIDFRDITDGSSHTLLFGEIMGGSLPVAQGGRSPTPGPAPALWPRRKAWTPP